MMTTDRVSENNKEEDDKLYPLLKGLGKQTSLPAAFLNLNDLDRNIEEVLQRTHNHLKIRLASKSIRCLEVMKYTLKKSPRFCGVMTYSPKESLYLLKEGIEDILLAYPTMNKVNTNELLFELKKKGPKFRFSFMVDCKEHLDFLSNLAIKHAIKIQICFDFDMSTIFPLLYFGVHRSPLKTKDQVYNLAQLVTQKHPQLQLIGFMGYEAQIAGVTDKTGNFFLDQLMGILKNLSKKSILKRRQECWHAMSQLISNQDMLLKNGGGTGCLEFTSEDKSINEVTVGSGLYSPALFDHYQEFHHRPALFYALEATRFPQKDVITCHGGGFIASGPQAQDKLPKIFSPGLLGPFTHEGFGEVQTPLKMSKNFNTPISLGDPIFFRHAKAGEICERFEDLHLIRDSKLAGTMKTYRGAGKCFH